MKRIIRQFYFIIIAIIFICTSARGNYPSDQGGEERVAPDGRSSDPGSAVLSMDIKEEPLKEVLERISDQNGITFVLPPSLAEEKVMLRFSNLTLEEALTKILSPYNHIFIYRESQRPSKSSVATLEKVRIFPHAYEGRVHESLMSIAEGISDSKGAVPSEGTEKERAASRDEGRRDETYIETLTTTLQEGDADAKRDAVKVHKDAGTVDAVRALSFALRDTNPTVQKEAVSALLAVGEELKAAADPETGVPQGGDEDTTIDNTKPEPAGPAPTLNVASSSGNSASIALSNEVNVGGVQFQVGGTKISGVRPTPRTEGFLTTFHEQSGTVILTSLSGKTIPPGNGPIVEIVHSGGRLNITGKTTIGTKP